MLHLSFSGPEPDQRTDEHYRRLESMERLAMTVADHLSLALANLKLRERLQEMSVRDPLTGLYNRRYMQETLEREIKRAQRASKPIGIIMLDVDHFRDFNNQNGHQAGDAVLKLIGNLLNKKTRIADVSARFGGDEFVVILPNASRSVTLLRAEQISQSAACMDLKFGNKNLEKISISCGVAVFPEDGTKADDLIKAADSALYHAKKHHNLQVAEVQRKKYQKNKINFHQLQTTH